MHARHHAYLERELPFLCELAVRVRGAHAAADERLTELVSVLARLRAELEAHIALQQRVLPRPVGRYESDLLELHARELEAELDTLAELTDGFAVDRLTCDQHRLLIRRVAALASDTEHQLRTERDLLASGAPLSAA